MVFSAYSNWTYDAEDVGLSNYCAKPPFDCAFVLLILNWVEKQFHFSPHNPQFVGRLTRDGGVHVLHNVLYVLRHCQDCLEGPPSRVHDILQERTTFLCVASCYEIGCDLI